MFSPIQKKLIACAATGTAGVFIAGIVFLVFAGLAKFVGTFSTVLWPIIIALILALLLQPVCEFLEKKLHFPRVVSVITLFVFLVGVLVLAALLIVPALFQQVTEFAQNVPVIWNRVLETHPNLAAWVEDRFREGGLIERIKENKEFGVQLKSLISSAIPKIQMLFGKAETVFSQIVAAAVVPIYFYYLISGRHDLIGKVETESKAILPTHVAEDLGFLMRQFRDIVIAFFRGQLIVVMCYSVVLAVGFRICGLQGGILFGLMLGMLNMVPYLGTIIGLCVVLPLAFFSGGIWLLLGVVVVFCVAQLLEAYVFTPIIMKKHTGLHPMIIMVSIFFWAVVFGGVLGMVLAVPLTAFIVVIWRLAKERYFPRMLLRGNADGNADGNAQKESLDATQE